ncbi:sensor domain-containing phosphodiesterase [Halobacillus litoralis]|uniref:sensor domain-containing phosphodiesterase n=1 Tax=Halobacillus litoralis TaxID=45668 RepID=UPI001CD1A53E|nr:sensor domain-containing phosphodiesterase [Halobacillus litoralis]MCA0971829.1 sensor domain-containing phosphodiesterase [Halobacillus litoralis]
MRNGHGDFNKQLLASLQGRNDKNAVHYILEQASLYFECDAATVYLLEEKSGRTIFPYKEFVRNSNIYPLSTLRRETILNLPSQEIFQLDASIYGEDAASYAMLLEQEEHQPLGALVLIHHTPFTPEDEEALRTITSCLNVYLSHLQSAKSDWNHRSYIEERIRRQQSDFMRLMKDARLTSIDLVPAFQMICESTAETLQVDRVAVWFFSEDRTTLECRALYDHPSKKFKNAQGLQKAHYPAYFSSLEENRSIVVEQTSDDFRVHELLEDYLAPLNIKALMDIPIISGGKTIGVLCCEHYDDSRNWSFDEEAFATSIGDMIAFINEHIKRRKAEKKAKELAYYDYLTHLPNRNALEEHLDTRMDQADGRSYFALIYLDIDGFTEMTERLGYRIGDQLLMAVTRRLKSALQKGEFISRLDYDGFAIVTNDTEVKNALYKRIHKYLESLKEPLMVDGQEFFITVSTGVVVFPEDGDSPATIVRNGHRANTEAKRLGRSMITFYRPSFDEYEFEQQWFHMDLAKALENEEFELYYQPQVHPFSKEVTGIEALVRWTHPEKGVIPPNEFIPLAEVTGLIVPLGKWILEKAVHQAIELDHQGMGDICVSVNISAIEFQHPEFLTHVKRVVYESGISPEKLRLEITETMAMDHEDYTIENLHHLQDLGVTVALDDFGTGYSSLKYLSLFPIQCLKIDRSFIRNVESNPKNGAIVQSIVDLAENLDLEVIAEGVETKEELRHLTAIGNQIIQGYYYSKPLPANELLSWIQSFQGE